MKLTSSQECSNTRRVPIALGLLVAAILALCSTAKAQLTTLDFDYDATAATINGASDPPPVLADQYSSLGVNFSGGAEILNSSVWVGSSYPPYGSEVNVVANVDVDTGSTTGPITADFSSPVNLVEAYFTYN